MRTIILACLFAATGFSFPGYVTTLELRLKTPIASYKTATQEAKFEGVVIAPAMLGTRVLMPAGTTVYGTIVRRRSIGMGLVRERATLDLSFDSYQVPDGRRVPFQGRLRYVENARESVNPNGRIDGILAANTPQGMLGAIWRNPTAELFQKSFLGIAGVSGRISAAYAMGPFGAMALFAIRCTIFRMPEPEIRLPAGTEMKVSVMGLPASAPIFDAPSPGELPVDVANWFASQPMEVSKVNGKLTEDIVNTGFIGSREQLVAAFRTAGWVEADSRSGRSVGHVWSSYTGQTGYPEAPASRLMYRGAEPDFVFQKSLNSITRRHHVRIWRVSDSGQETWLGAATHDIDITFHSREMAFTHKIDPQIDTERDKVVTDLAYAGCSDSEPAYVSRAAARRSPGVGKTVVSDGRLAVIELHDCAGERAPNEPLPPMPDRSVFARITRRIVLDARQYLLRDNPYYWIYQGFSFHRRRAQAYVEY